MLLLAKEKDIIRQFLQIRQCLLRGGGVGSENINSFFDPNAYAHGVRK